MLIIYCVVFVNPFAISSTVFSFTLHCTILFTIRCHVSWSLIMISHELWHTIRNERRVNNWCASSKVHRRIEASANLAESVLSRRFQPQQQRCFPSCDRIALIIDCAAFVFYITTLAIRAASATWEMNWSANCIIQANGISKRAKVCRGRILFDMLPMHVLGRRKRGQQQSRNAEWPDTPSDATPRKHAERHATCVELINSRTHVLVFVYLDLAHLPANKCVPYVHTEKKARPTNQHNKIRSLGCAQFFRRHILLQ